MTTDLSVYSSLLSTYIFGDKCCCESLEFLSLLISTCIIKGAMHNRNCLDLAIKSVS